MTFRITPAKYQEIKEIFVAAIELPLEEREKFLDENCRDEETRRQIERLLKAQEEAGGFLEDSAVAVVQNSLDKNDSLVGKSIEKYRIVREIGRGGMGAVYLAEREDFHQQVALKLIKRGMDSDAILERFKREREILATLVHPSITRLLDGGTTADGKPFFVMEYVEGAPVDEYCKNNILSEKTVLELFRKICEAVSFAHQKLVVHRDLKPSNILIDVHGEPKLLDFGIAKLLNSSDASQTQTDMRVLTPAYASPEQLRGEIVGTASDVYSLGIILTEMLGIEKESFKTQSLSNEPKTGDRRLNRDLQNILAKSLQADASRRYQSVEQFSEDVRRYLTGMPVTARKDSFIYRASKFVRRNRLVVSIAVLFLLSFAAALWQTREAGRARERAEIRFNDVRKLANSFMFEFHDAIESLPGSTPARQLVVKRALEYLNQLAQESGDDSTLQRELATAYERIGKVQGNSYYANLGDTDGALKSYNRSLEMRQKLFAADPNNIELQSELAASYEGVGDMLYTVNDLKGGLENYEKALQIRQNLADGNNIEELAALAQIYSKIGDIKGLDGYPNLGDTAGALEAYQKSVEINQHLADSSPDNEKYQYEYAQRLQNLGGIFGIVGKTKESIETVEKAGGILTALSVRNPNNAEYKLNKLSNLILLRWVLSEDGRDAEAITLTRKTISELEKMSGTDPENSFLRRSLGTSYNALGKNLLQTGDARGGLENCRKALDIAESMLAADGASAEKKQDVIRSLGSLADAQFAIRDYRAALVSYRRAEALLEELLKEDANDIRTIDDLAIIRAGIGKSSSALGDDQTALENLQTAAEGARQAAQNSPLNVRLQSRMALRNEELGKIYEHLGKIEQAKLYYQQSLEIWNRLRQQNALRKIDIEPFEKTKRSVTHLLNG